METAELLWFSHSFTKTIANFQAVITVAFSSLTWQYSQRLCIIWRSFAFSAHFWQSALPSILAAISSIALACATFSTLIWRVTFSHWLISQLVGLLSVLLFYFLLFDAWNSAYFCPSLHFIIIFIAGRCTTFWLSRNPELCHQISSLSLFFFCWVPRCLFLASSLTLMAMMAGRIFAASSFSSQFSTCEEFHFHSQFIYWSIISCLCALASFETCPQTLLRQILMVSCPPILYLYFCLCFCIYVYLYHSTGFYFHLPFDSTACLSLL